MSLLAVLILSLAQPDPSVSRVAVALADGRVGERYDGYLDFVVPPDEATRRAVAAVNVKRRALYIDLGTRRNIAPQKVGITTGCRLLERVPEGGRYKLADGEWAVRAPGDAAPRPDYCVMTSNAAR